MEKKLSDTKIKIVHAIKGRVRFRISALKNNDTLAEEIIEQISSIEGINRVETNVQTGSVLILYDPEKIMLPDSLQKLQGTLPAIFPGLDPEQLKTWLENVS